MARGELMKKLLASYGQEDAFRAVAEQIIGDKALNRVDRDMVVVAWVQQVMS